MGETSQTVTMKVGRFEPGVALKVPTAAEMGHAFGSGPVLVSGTLPPGITAVNGGALPGGSVQWVLTGTPKHAGEYFLIWTNYLSPPDRIMMLIAVAPAYPVVVPDGGDPAVPPVVAAPATTVRLTWFQARVEAVAGVRIRRAGWVDRYVEYDRGLWFLQPLNATTQVLGTRRLVAATDWSADEFRATDWTYEGILGQLATAGQASATVSVSLRFP